MGIPPRSRGTVLVRARTSYAARRLLLPVQKFVHMEASSGVVLLAAAVCALIWANSRWSGSYDALWNTEVSLRTGTHVLSHSIREWINDLLMVGFFFVVGLEIKREFVHGALSGLQRASLPVACAIGGMAVPATLYYVLNAGTAAANGWGIPMATDIAFALGALALLGDRISPSARIFLLALATADDIGAILVIALFYTQHVSLDALAAAVILLALLLAMRKAGVRAIVYYLPIGVLLWLAVLESGVHATVAGVVLGMLVPTEAYWSKEAYADAAEALLRDMRASTCTGGSDAMLGEMEELTASTEAPADRLVRVLHPWSSYVILPLFALANAGVSLSAHTLNRAFASGATRGVVAGLVIGKVIGIASFGYLAVRFRLATLMEGVEWRHMIGIGLLGGIGFTVSLFITDLAFTDVRLIEVSKLGVLLASLASGIAGFMVLRVLAFSRATRRSRAQ